MGVGWWARSWGITRVCGFGDAPGRGVFFVGGRLGSVNCLREVW